MIEQFLKFDISFFSAFLLLMVLLIMRIRKEIHGVSNKLYKRIIWVNIYMLFLEILTWQFDRQAGQSSYYLNYFFNMLFAWSTPLITVTWAYYIDYKMFSDVKRLSPRRYYIPIMGCASLLIGINFFYPLIFTVDALNVYRRESYMLLLVVLNSYVHFTLIYIAFKNRDHIPNEIVKAILLFVFAPAIASVIQVKVFGAFILWPLMAVTLVITYIFLETISTSKDYLTGLYSRFRVDQKIDSLISESKDFGLLMIDLNDFKLINDRKGHQEGDKTLISFSRALEQVFKNERMIARYGGDEFVVITHLLSEAERSAYYLELNTLTADIVSYSIGYKGSDQNEHITYEAMLNGADFKMYEDKKKKKSS